MKNKSKICVAVCRRVGRTAIAVVGKDGIYDVQCCASSRRTQRQLHEKTQAIANAYGARTIVVEPGFFADVTSEIVVVTTTLADAKKRLCGSHDCAHRQLVDAVIRNRPEVKRVIAGASLTGHRANQDRWRIVPVFAIALGLAFLQT